MEYDYYRYTVAVSLSPLLLSSPSLSGFHSVTFLWRNESTERWTDKHRLWHQGSTAWERGSCWYGNNDGLNKKKEKKDQTVFQSPPSPSFLWKSKNWACDLCFRCFWALYYTISKHIQSTYLMILFLAFIASCKTGDKVYILIETHQFTGGKKYFACTEFTF